jgi:hypothetical protein
LVLHRLVALRPRAWVAALGPVARSHGLAAAVYTGVVLASMWPMFGPGSPPGVDTPTFLHLASVLEQGLTGDLGALWTDPYWYGGWPYVQAYPPVAYGTIAIISALSPIPIEISYRIATALALIGLGLSVYALALEYQVHKAIALWAGVLSLLSYSLFVSLGIFGWFSTVFAIPFSIAGLAVLERAIRTGSGRAAIASGILFALSLLAHHMTGFGIAVAMVPWALYHLIAKPYPRRQTARMIAYSAAAVAAVAGVWMIAFLVHVTGVGFEREVPGNWRVDVEEMRRRAIERSFIGREAYPSYIGLIQVPLAIAGIIYAFISRGRLIAPSLMLIVLTWIAFGENALPLLNYYPFSGLDVARFTVFMAPLMAVLSAVFLDSIVMDITHLANGRGFRTRLAVPAALTVGMLALLIVPVQDSLKARGRLTPTLTTPQVEQAMRWIRDETPESARILAVGFRNWHTWWVPERSDRPIMGGWNDEGAPDWRTIREIRHMGWFGRVNSLRLYDIMELRETDYLLIYHWEALDSPALFEAAAGQDPFLFTRRAAWPGVTIFERREFGT